MEKRGRKSIVKLSVEANRPVVIRRCEPPAEITDAELSVWNRIIDDEPEGAFTPEHADLLLAYCQHVVQSQVLASLIAAVTPRSLRTKAGLAKYEKLLNMREKEVRSASSLATRLRITRQATYDPKTLSRAKTNQTGRGAKPWEIDDDD